jgi:hypothetical protein
MQTWFVNPNAFPNSWRKLPKQGTWFRLTRWVDCHETVATWRMSDTQQAEWKAACNTHFVNNYWTELRIFVQKKKSGVLYHQCLNFELPYHLTHLLIRVQHLVKDTTWRIKVTTRKPNSTRHGYDLDNYDTLIYSELKEKDTRIQSLQTALILCQVYSGSCGVQLIQWFDFPLSNHWLFQYGLPRNLPSLCLPSSYPVIRHTYNTSKTSSYKFPSISYRQKYQLYISTVLTDAIMSLRPTTLQSSVIFRYFHQNV